MWLASLRETSLQFINRFEQSSVQRLFSHVQSVARDLLRINLGRDRQGVRVRYNIYDCRPLVPERALKCILQVRAILDAESSDSSRFPNLGEIAPWHINSKVLVACNAHLQLH